MYLIIVFIRLKESVMVGPKVIPLGDTSTVPDIETSMLKGSSIMFQRNYFQADQQMFQETIREGSL